VLCLIYSVRIPFIRRSLFLVIDKFILSAALSGQLRSALDKLQPMVSPALFKKSYGAFFDKIFSYRHGQTHEGLCSRKLKPGSLPGQRIGSPITFVVIMPLNLTDFLHLT